MSSSTGKNTDYGIEVSVVIDCRVGDLRAVACSLSTSYVPTGRLTLVRETHVISGPEELVKTNHQNEVSYLVSS